MSSDKQQRGARTANVSLHGYYDGYDEQSGCAVCSAADSRGCFLISLACMSQSVVSSLQACSHVHNGCQIAACTSDTSYSFILARLVSRMIVSSKLQFSDHQVWLNSSID